jgi:hypothetical protein
LRAAILRGLRPTTLLLGKQPYSKWNRLDRLLLEAYQLLEDETSTSSGLPIWLTRSLDPNIQFIVESGIDNADAAIADWDKKHGGDKSKPGQYRFAVPVDANGNRIEYGGLTRHSFREAAASLVSEEREGRDIIELDGKYAIPPED